MKRSDFKKITPEYINSAKRLIDANGSCMGLYCMECPFDDDNNTTGENMGCREMNYRDDSHYNTSNLQLVKSCLEFLKLPYETENTITTKLKELEEYIEFLYECGSITYGVSRALLEKIEEIKQCKKEG